jgi:hypothetical protein
MHLSAWLFLGNAYEIAVFQDAASRLATGQGVYEGFSNWLRLHGEGYYAYPPLYAYMLWASGTIANAFGGHWWLTQLAIKAWMLIADLFTVILLYRIRPSAAKDYWTLWYIPVVAIGLVQPDLWVGLSVLMALLLAQRGRWIGTGIALAFAIGTKMTPIVVLPFLALHLINTRRLAALLRVAIGVTVGLVLVVLPYAIAFGDLGKFREVLLFHLQRPVAGLNAVAGLQMLVDGTLTVAMLLGGQIAASNPWPGAFQGAAAVYPVFTILIFVTAAILARAQQWSLEQAFCVPLLVLLLSSKVVHEQYALHVLPLMLVAFPGAWSRLAGPYAVYVIAAGTPWRFFPSQYALPSTLDALIPARFHALLGPWILVSFVIIAAVASLVFSWQLCRLVWRLSFLSGYSLKRTRLSHMNPEILEPQHSAPTGSMS